MCCSDRQTDRQTASGAGGEMRYTFKPDDCMVISIPLGSLRNMREGQLMPEKFTCVFKDAYKVFLKGRPKELGVRATLKCIILYVFLEFSLFNICRQKSFSRNISDVRANQQEFSTGDFYLGH